MTLEIDLDKKLNLDLQADIVGRRIAVLGVSGQGKTNTAAVLIEEILTAGLPCTIVDPEGEYWGLKEKFEILVVGRGEHVDFKAGTGQAAALASLSVTEGIPMILDLSEFKKTEQADFLLEYFTSLWEAASEKRIPYEVVIEEAHRFLPERFGTPLKEQLDLIATGGRKRGLGAIIISQRSAAVAKSFLTQAEMLFLHRVIHPTDLRVYRDLIPLPGKEVDDLVGQLQRGQVVFVYNHEAAAIKIRQRDTFHAGATPTLDAQVAGRLKKIDKSLLDKLAQAVKDSADGSGQAGRSDKEARLEKRVKELEEVNGQLKAQVADQVQQIATLKDLKVRLESQVVFQPVAGPARVQPLEQKANQAGQPKKLQEKIAELPKERQTAIHTNTEKLIVGKLRTELNPFDLKRLNTFLDKIYDLSERETALFTFLLQHDGAEFTKSELFEFTGIPMKHFYQDFPRLIKLPFVANRSGGSKTVNSKVNEWSKQAFPGVEPSAILRLIKETL